MRRRLRHRDTFPALVVAAGVAGAASAYLALRNPATTYPKPDVPGITDPHVTPATLDSTICVPGYTATVRPPVSYTGPLKTRLMAAHHYTDSQSDYELDHLIPLELGGAPGDPGNLWLSRQPQARSDDKQENALRAEVCNGSIDLAAAQAQIVALKQAKG
jgi:hypothetical protein